MWTNKRLTDRNTLDSQAKHFDISFHRRTFHTFAMQLFEDGRSSEIIQMPKKTTAIDDFQPF